MALFVIWQSNTLDSRTITSITPLNSLRNPCHLWSSASKEQTEENTEIGSAQVLIHHLLFTLKGEIETRYAILYDGFFKAAYC